MNDFDWKSLVGSVSPILATALGGPFAGAAVKVIADKVLGKPDASEEEVAAALSAGVLTGEQATAIRQAELAWNLEMERIAQADTQNARQQTIALAQAGSGIAWGAPLISALIVIGYFGCIYMLFIKREDMPPNSFQLMNVMFGVLSLAFGQVCNYWLGSSAGSKRSGDALRTIAEKQTLPTSLIPDRR